MSCIIKFIITFVYSILLKVAAYVGSLIMPELRLSGQMHVFSDM